MSLKLGFLCIALFGLGGCSDGAFVSEQEGRQAGTLGGAAEALAECRQDERDASSEPKSTAADVRNISDVAMADEPIKSGDDSVRKKDADQEEAYEDDEEDEDYRYSDERSETADEPLSQQEYGNTWLEQEEYCS